ncbi:hypothetical protein Aduo_005120 [Ancylostoma duodenale]
MFTPLRAPTLQERTKRARIEDDSPVRDPEIASALDLLKADESIPDHVKCLISHLIDNRDQMMAWIIQKKP